MATVRPRTFEYGVTLDREWAARSDRGGAPLPSDESTWTPEHLVLTGLVRCVLRSLDYHARRAGLEVASSAGRASGSVTLREEDGRFAFVAIDVEADVELDPSQPAEAARELTAKAEHDCFVSASLTVKPSYRWNVDGAALA
jgi:organic hydroperoxide reductase OsmC/OhrA